VDAQSTFTLEIAVGMWNRSGKTASNLQHGKYQDLIRGSLVNNPAQYYSTGNVRIADKPTRTNRPELGRGDQDERLLV
jgi:hypothetical protein